MKYVIVNLQREFWDGEDWTKAYSKAEIVTDGQGAINGCTPLGLKAYVVQSYGEAGEVEIFRNFTEGRSLTWGRRSGGMKAEIVYKCIFDFKSNRQEACSGESISDFVNGFWITRDMEFTKGIDGKYWIPPSAIRYIEKTKGETVNASRV